MFGSYEARNALICKPRASLGYYPEERVVYVEEERKQKKGPGMGTALLAGW